MEIKCNCVIGIDPGAGGGLAVYVPGRKTRVLRMPKELSELRDFFAYYADNFTPVVFLEKLSVRPDDVASDGNRMGKLYRVQKMMANYEHLKAIIEVAEIPYIMVHPLSWQSKLQLRKRGEREEKMVRKRRYREKAAELYPDARVTLWNADALLILHFGRWALLNDLSWVSANLPKREHDKLFERC